MASRMPDNAIHAYRDRMPAIIRHVHTPIGRSRCTPHFTIHTKHQMELLNHQNPGQDRQVQSAECQIGGRIIDRYGRTLQTDVGCIPLFAVCSPRAAKNTFRIRGIDEEPAADGAICGNGGQWPTEKTRPTDPTGLIRSAGTIPSRTHTWCPHHTMEGYGPSRPPVSSDSLRREEPATARRDPPCIPRCPGRVPNQRRRSTCPLKNTVRTSSTVRRSGSPSVPRYPPIETIRRIGNHIIRKHEKHRVVD
jgi:hypothetical protein